jgi:pyruvate kinase
MRRTKIVCTLGPATSDRQRILDLAYAGMDVARLNFSHGTHAEHAERFRSLRDLETVLGRPTCVLQDLSGPKLRIGDLPPEGVELRKGRMCALVGGPYEAGAEPRIPLPIPDLLRGLAIGHHVFLDDGQIALAVVDQRDGVVHCRVDHGGILMPRKGITAPDVPLRIAALTDKDLADLAFGLDLGVDWVAVSFIRRAVDLAPVRALAQRKGTDVRIIAKIEKPEALEFLDEILSAADGLMVARGDLGVEMPLYQVPIAQKDLIRRCNRAGKPCITATQMLESMTRSPRPTRAEASDVANAVMDGTDALMLSGETAMGEFPVEAVETMANIAEYTERHLDYEALLREALRPTAENITDAISQGVAQIAAELSVDAILCSTTSGHTARMVSRTHPRMPIIAATANERTYRRLPLIRGVRPLLVKATTNTDEMLAATVQGALNAGWIQHGQTVVITSGVPVGTPGSTNLIKVQRV